MGNNTNKSSKPITTIVVDDQKNVIVAPEPAQAPVNIVPTTTTTTTKTYGDPSQTLTMPPPPPSSIHHIELDNLPPISNSTTSDIPQLVTFGKFTLPFEHLLHIASFLDANTLVRAYRTSKAVHQAFNSSQVWQAICKQMKAKPVDMTWKHFYFAMRGPMVIEFENAVFVESSISYTMSISNISGKHLITPMIHSGGQAYFKVPLCLQVAGHAKCMLLHSKRENYGDSEVEHTSSRIFMEEARVQQVEHEIPVQNVLDALNGVTGDLRKCKISIDFVVSAKGYAHKADFDQRLSNPDTEMEWQGGRLVSVNSLIVDWVAKTVQITK